MGKVKSSDSSRLRQYVSDFKEWSLLIVKFSFVRHVENVLSQHLSGSKHFAAIAQLKKRLAK
jgi:hypothetical protein